VQTAKRKWTALACCGQFRTVVPTHAPLVRTSHNSHDCAHERGVEFRCCRLMDADVCQYRAASRIVSTLTPSSAARSLMESSKALMSLHVPWTRWRTRYRGALRKGNYADVLRCIQMWSDATDDQTHICYLPAKPARIHFVTYSTRGRLMRGFL
jgi:hypothetical protein